VARALGISRAAYARYGHTPLPHHLIPDFVELTGADLRPAVRRGRDARRGAGHISRIARSRLPASSWSYDFLTPVFFAVLVAGRGLVRVSKNTVVGRAWRDGKRRAAAEGHTIRRRLQHGYNRRR
jgi:hypothetical protein